MLKWGLFFWWLVDGYNFQKDKIGLKIKRLFSRYFAMVKN